ncbi:MAG: copper chaperone PCu(A)C, partial [Chloroflexota bacterium]
RSATFVAMRRNLSFLAALPVVVGAVLALAACSGSAAKPQVSDVWARPGVASAESAAYLAITAPSGQGDALLSASSPAANMVQLHEVSTDADGMTGMHHIDRLDIPAGATVRLEPGGYHLMLMGLTGELAEGGTIELTLVFERAGSIVVQAEIRQG